MVGMDNGLAGKGKWQKSLAWDGQGGPGLSQASWLAPLMCPTPMALPCGSPALRYLTRAILNYKELAAYMTVMVPEGRCGHLALGLSRLFPPTG